MDTPFFIHVSIPGAQPQTFTIDEPKDDGFLLGRARAADLRLPHPTISGSHARLKASPSGAWTLTDLDSRNGISISGAATRSVEVAEGLTVELGQATLRFSSSESPPAPSNRNRPINTQEVAISRLGESDATATTRARIAEIAAAGQSLWSIDDDAQRRQALCDLLIAPTMDAWSAVILELDPASHKATNLARAKRRAAPTNIDDYVSRRMLAAIAEDPAPALGRTHALASDEIHLSIDAGGAAIAAFVCRLAEHQSNLEILFLTLPIHLGTQSRLLELAMIAEQYRGASAAADLRLQRADAARRDAELERAHAIQQNLLPTTAASLARNALVHAEPCHEVGGDYADVIPIDEDRTILVIADVAGKGIHAALVAAQIHSLANFSFNTDDTLEDLAQRLNRMMTRHLDLAVFATCVIALLDTRTNTLRLANAGHPHPLLADANGNVRPLAAQPGPPLGILDEPPPVSDVQVQHGDTLLLYSDGLSELPTTAPDVLLGVEGVQDIFAKVTAQASSLEDRRTALIEHLEQLNDANPTKLDDQTFLIADLRPNT